MSELIQTLNRGTVAFFQNWLGPTGFLLMLSMAARYWWLVHVKREETWADGYHKGRRSGLEDGAAEERLRASMTPEQRARMRERERLLMEGMLNERRLRP